MKNSRPALNLRWITIAPSIAIILIVSTSLADTPTPPSSVPFIVQIHADWCRTCKKLEPTWVKIRDEFSDSSRIVRFDVSDREAYEASTQKAKKLGIEAFFLEYRRKTGIIAVLDCRTREPTTLLRGELDIEKYRKGVNQAVASC